MSVRVSIAGQKEMARALNNMSADIEQAVSNVVLTTAMELRGQIVRSVQRGPKTGFVYQKYNPRRVHQASAPGEAPATDTGRLANSIFFDQASNLTATVGSNIVYAKHLEYGTRHMGARPFFTPAVEEMRPKFLRRISNAIGVEIR